MSGPALLDVNVLVALFDPAHVHHEAAHGWFGQERAMGWATCAVTENALVRILANSAYASPTLRPAESARMLGIMKSNGGHVFWGHGASITDTRIFALDQVAGHRQLTDVYLLGLAVSAGGRLATFDRRIPLQAVRGAKPAHLVLIPA